MTYSVYNIKVDNKLTFAPGITAGYVLSINSDGSTSWVEPQGSGGSLSVDFIGLSSEVFLAEPISLTASTTTDFAIYDVGTQSPPNGVIYPVDRYKMDNNYEDIWFSSLGTQSIIFIQSDSTSSSGTIKKDFLVKERDNPKYIYTGGQTSNIVIDNQLFIFSSTKIDDFSQKNIWYTNHGDTVWGIAVDGSGNIYTGGIRTSDLTTRKYNSDGDLIWSRDHGADLRSIAVDASGNVYTGGTRTSNLTTRKYNSSGDLLWSVDHGNRVEGIAVDSSGNVYTGGIRTLDLTTRKYDSSGDILWSVDHGSTVLGIAVDVSGNVYTSGIRNNLIGGVFNTTRKYDSSGNLIWSVDHGGVSINAIAVDSSGNVYTGGPRSNFITTRKYDSSGNLLWSVDHGTTVLSIAVDSSGNVYTGGQVSIPSTGVFITTRKYDSSGNLLWSVGSEPTQRGIDTFPPNKGAFLS